MVNKSLSFPKMFNKNSVETLEGAKATKNNLELILRCEKGEQLGDPDFGVNLHKAKFTQNLALAKELATDGILDSQKFMNNVIFNREGVSLAKTGVSKVDIKIEAIFSESVNKKDLVVIEGVNIDE